MPRPLQSRHRIYSKRAGFNPIKNNRNSEQFVEQIIWESIAHQFLQKNLKKFWTNFWCSLLDKILKIVSRNFDRNTFTKNLLNFQRSEYLGLVLSTKFSEKFLGILTKFSDFWKFLRFFENVFVSKFLGKNPQNFVQLAAPKFSDFCQKIGPINKISEKILRIWIVQFSLKNLKIFWQTLV